MRRPFKEINITYAALLIGQLVFAGIVIYLIKNDRGEIVDTSDLNLPLPFHLITPTLMVGGFIIAYLIDQQRLTQAQKYNFELPRKLMHYKTSILLRSAIIEGVNLFAVIAALVSHNINYLYYFAFGILFFLYFKPSFSKFADIYRITPAEKSQIR